MASFDRNHHLTRMGGPAPCFDERRQGQGQKLWRQGNHRMIHTLPDLLFCNSDLHPVMEHQKATMLKEIESLGKATVLKNDLDSLAATYAEKYAGAVPVLREAEKEAEHDEIEIDVSQDPRRMAYFFNDDGPVYVKATRLKIWVPFDGDAAFFSVRPSTFNLNPPRGEIRGNSVACVIVDDNLNQERLDRTFNDWLRDMNEYLTWHQQGLGEFNSTLVGIARSSLLTRRQQLKSTEDMLTGLNIPMRRAADTVNYPTPVSPLPTRRRSSSEMRASRPRMKHDCFISYAGDDRPLVESIVAALERAAIKVWWDRGQIRLGDRLTQKIDEGLSQSRYGLIIVSPAFMGKRWPESELRALANRAIRSGHRVILPILVGMDHDAFAAKYPLLADIVSTTFSGDLKALVTEITAAMD
jgi:hypothetical protein